MAGDKKYIVLQNNYSLSYDDDKCYENDIEIEFDPKSDAKTHVLKKKVEFYNSIFKKSYKNLVVLTAAGTSLDNGKNKGKTRSELWNFCKAEIEEFKAIIPGIENKTFYLDNDIEGLLSYIILCEKLDDAKKANIILKKIKLEEKIKIACSLELDKSSAPHKNFLDKITARKSNDPRIQLFTTNYDTLFEQAAIEGGFVVIDGFSFTQPRKFSGRYFDYDIVNREKTRIKQEESFVSKVFHLYKLHGSINWERDAVKGIIQKETSANPLIIYPAADKYESSYEQPYFEMMSRFQQSLRQDNTLLIVLGFGFQDKHIQNVIIEAVSQNPSFQLVITNFNVNDSIDVDTLKDFFEEISTNKTKRKVTVIFDKFKDFTDNYPENQIYSKDNNEPL
ncbi:MAG: SIR2 family protein [Paludibacter sp.]